jgi:hypothetical protein
MAPKPHNTQTSERSWLEMVTIVKQVREDDAGFVMKLCVTCLTHRAHAVALSWTEVAWFTLARKAALTCSECGFEREVEGDAATLLAESAVSREMLDETLSLRAFERDTRQGRPVGTEWLVEDQPLQLAARY